MLARGLEGAQRVDDFLGRLGATTYAAGAIRNNQQVTASERESGGSILPGAPGLYANRNLHDAP